MNSFSERSFVTKTSSMGSDKSVKKSTGSSGSSGSSGSDDGRTISSHTHSSTSTDLGGSYDPFYTSKLIKKEFEQESCLRLSNCVAVVGVLSMCIHIVEFFAYTYLLTAFFLIHYDALPRSTNVWWNVVYPSGLILHTIVQCFFAVLLIVGALKKRKSYMLPYIIAEGIEIALLAKASIILAVTGDHASMWIIATTVAFMSVQVFYVILAGRLYRRFKREELEVLPPVYESKQPSPASSVSAYLYKV